MSLLLRQVARYAVQKLASDPELRRKTADAARTVAEEARQIAAEDDRARAAGRAVRRALNRLQAPGDER